MPDTSFLTLATDVAPLVHALRAADDTFGPAPHTMYGWAADELEERGAPRPGWPDHALLLVYQGVVALPEAGRFAADVGRLVRLMAPFPHLAWLVSAALHEHLMPGDAWAVPLLLDAAQGAGTLAPEPAVRALAVIGDRAVVDPLLDVVSQPRHRVATSAALVLGRLRAREAAAPLLGLLGRRRDPEVVTALGLLGVREAAPVLHALLDAARLARPSRRTERDAELLAATARALGRIGDAGASASLRALLDDPYVDVALAAADALTRLDDPDGARRLHAHLYVWEAARRLAQLGHADGVAAMRACYRADPNARPRGLARDPGGRRLLLQALGHEGDAADLAFVHWVAAHDVDRTEQGWTLAEEARRAARRIEARASDARRWDS
ncbi:hypothetical protein [Roseisolibacter agri]|nr:hypothetical protein [Roseisolibacter agri]